MKISGFRKRLREPYRRMANALSPFVSPLLNRFHHWIGSVRLGITRPQALAYQVIGERTARFLPLFRDVDNNLRRSGIMISFRGYVSLCILTTLFISTLAFPTVSLCLFSILHLSFHSSMLFGVGISLLTGASCVIGYYVYPIYRADSLKRNLEDSLPFTTGYMEILARAGVPPYRIFRSLAQVDAPSVVSKEARVITRDVELFGFDVISALEGASKRTPSEEFKELLEGFIATVHSGGNLANYLRTRARRYTKLNRIALKKFSDTLGVLSEFYVTMLVAGPLILVVMLGVMSMLGGNWSGFLNSHLMLYLLTYIGIPVGSIIFLIILDALSPRR